MSLLGFFDFCTFNNNMGEGKNAQLVIFPNCGIFTKVLISFERHFSNFVSERYLVFKIFCSFLVKVKLMNNRSVSRSVVLNVNLLV